MRRAAKARPVFGMSQDGGECECEEKNGTHGKAEWHWQGVCKGVLRGTDTGISARMYFQVDEKRNDGRPRGEGKHGDVILKRGINLQEETENE